MRALNVLLERDYCGTSGARMTDPRSFRISRTLCSVRLTLSVQHSLRNISKAMARCGRDTHDQSNWIESQCFIQQTSSCAILPCSCLVGKYMTMSLAKHTNERTLARAFSMFSFGTPSSFAFFNAVASCGFSARSEPPTYDGEILYLQIQPNNALLAAVRMT